MANRGRAFSGNRNSLQHDREVREKDFTQKEARSGNGIQKENIRSIHSTEISSGSINKSGLIIKTDHSGIPSTRIRTSSVLTERIASIDILRALTMVLMIFVNDLGSLKNIPTWLDHVKPGVDGIGLADTVFPAFLFILGMSLPYALQNRRNKGDTTWQLVQHVLWRSLALLVMGVFLVNGETINKNSSGMGFYLWDALCCLSFILIWNAYPKKFSKILINLCKGVGILILFYLAYIYRGSDGGPIYRFGPQWWGILGLIGWAYLVTGLVTVFSKGNFYVLLGSWIFFSILSILYAAKLFGEEDFLSLVPEPVIDGTLVGFAMGGVVISTIFQFFKRRNENRKMTVVFFAAALGLFGLFVYTHRFFILAKLGATPPWLFLCSALTILAFTLIYWICDINAKAKWFKPIQPAGTDTLLCYLVPYLLIMFFHEIHLKLPHILFSGGLGLVKSFVFSMLCVYITLGLNRAGVKLKL